MEVLELFEAMSYHDIYKVPTCSSALFPAASVFECITQATDSRRRAKESLIRGMSLFFIYLACDGR